MHVQYNYAMLLPQLSTKVKLMGELTQNWQAGKNISPSVSRNQVSHSTCQVKDLICLGRSRMWSGRLCTQHPGADVEVLHLSFMTWQSSWRRLWGYPWVEQIKTTTGISVHDAWNAVMDQLAWRTLRPVNSQSKEKGTHMSRMTELTWSAVWRRWGWWSLLWWWPRNERKADTSWMWSRSIKVSLWCLINWHTLMHNITIEHWCVLGCIEVLEYSHNRCTVIVTKWRSCRCNL